MRNSFLCLIAISTVACAGSPPPPAAPATESSRPAATTPEAPPEASSPIIPTSDAPAADAAGESTPRAKDAAKWLRDLTEDGIDAAQRGVIATNGLSEEQFGLPAPLRKGMEAAMSPRFDPSQQDRILVAALEEGAPDVVQELCKKPLAEVVKIALSAPTETRAKLVIDQCKLASYVDVASVPKDSFVQPLLAAVVQKLFLREGGHSKAELELARMIAAARNR